jgi:hypothetical protein
MKMASHIHKSITYTNLSDSALATTTASKASARMTIGGGSIWVACLWERCERDGMNGRMGKWVRWRDFVGTQLFFADTVLRWYCPPLVVSFAGSVLCWYCPSLDILLQTLAENNGNDG